jgi:Mg-chelatase subunit ChlD/uncharacterized membrane protein
MGGVSAAVDGVMHAVTWLAPRWLLALVALPIVWLALAGSLTDLARRQRLLGGVTRTLLLALLVLALARPARLAPDDTVETIFLVDVSDSVSDEQLAAAGAQVTAALRDRDRRHAHVITFAEDARVVPLPPQGPPALERHLGRGAGTDVAGALRLGETLLGEDRVPRVMVLSDGQETTGSAVAQAALLARRGARVHVWPLPAPSGHEVAVVSLELPAGIKVGAPFDVTAELYATDPVDLDLALYQDELANPLEPRKHVHLAPGRTRTSFRSQVHAAGVSHYRVAIAHASGDTGRRENDQARAAVEIHGAPHLLYVEGEPASARYLRQALAAEHIEVDVRSPEGMPRAVRDFDRYDAVLFSDVPAVMFSAATTSALDTYVRELGGGLIVTAGEETSGLGGSPLEGLLPLRFDAQKRREEPSLGLVLLIDRSGSMAGEKIELAKEAAKATAEALGPQDLIGVVAFDTQPIPLVRLQRASNRLHILSDIAKLQAGGGTAILPALQEAAAELGPARAKVKHVILLTDGQAPPEGILELVAEMREAKITVTAVGIGSGADHTQLTSIAERGGGRFYFTQDPQSIPRIFLKETSQVARSALVEDEVHVHAVKRAQLLAGVDLDHAPPLRGYVESRPKPMGEVLVVSDRGDPILARARAGLGQAVVFTSDVKNRWATAWLNWPGYGTLWSQLVRQTMRHRTAEGISLSARVEPPRAHLVLDAVSGRDQFMTDLACEAQVFDPEQPRAPREHVLLPEVAPGRYEASLMLDRFGSYLARATCRKGEEPAAEVVASLPYPYPAEFLRVGIDEARLAAIAAHGGGRLRPTPAELWSADGQTVTAPRELWPRLLVAALALLIADIFLRRVRLFGYRS